MTTTLAHTINPFAGLHVISPDARDQEAARRAGEASMREFPYYRERFGDRAALFGASDGAWLLTLCDADAGHVRSQVLWLGSVLSARGVPQWLLERHLEILHGELLRATADERRCAPLLQGARVLRGLRGEQIAEHDFQRLAEAFAARADAEWARRLPWMGAILVSAVCDKAAGIGKAVTSMHQWAADPSIFPPAWVSAVLQTLAEARAAVRSHPHPF